MTTPVVQVRSDLALETALATFIMHQGRHLAVVDVNGQCVGVLSDRAVVSAWATDPSALAGACVGEAPLHLALVATTATVGEAAHIMHQLHTDSVMVVDKLGCPAGILTASDLVRLLDEVRS